VRAMSEGYVVWMWVRSRVGVYPLSSGSLQDVNKFDFYLTLGHNHCVRVDKRIIL
jgi:hypothetical protein